MRKRTMKYRLRTPALFLGFGGLALLLVAALTIDRGLGKDVLLIAPHDASVVELNRGLFLPGDSVADIYGNPLSKPVRVIGPEQDRLIRPQENPDLLLLSVNKIAGENPLQAQTIWFFTKLISPFLLVLGVLGFFLPRRPELRLYQAA